MKKYLLLLLLFISPLFVSNALLNNAKVYNTIQKNNLHLSFWQVASIDGHTWPNILLMGSSLMRFDVNPIVMQEYLHKSTGSLAATGDSVSTDYYTLDRIVATCTHCPSTIIYAPTDLSLKNHEPDSWDIVTGQRLLEVYIDSPLNYSLLKKSATFDEKYRDYFYLFTLERIDKIYFLRRELFAIAGDTLRNIYEKLTHASNVKQVFYTSEYGFHSTDQKMTSQIAKQSIDQYTHWLSDYQTGGATGLYLNNFFALAKKKNIRIIVVFHPISTIYQKKFSKEHTLYVNYVKQIAKKYAFTYIDNSDFMSSHFEYFSDPDHLNTKGSELYSHYVSTQLQQLLKNN